MASQEGIQREPVAQEGCLDLPCPPAELWPEEARGANVRKCQIWEDGLLCDWHIFYFGVRGFDLCWVPEPLNSIGPRGGGGDSAPGRWASVPWKVNYGPVVRAQCE